MRFLILLLTYSASVLAFASETPKSAEAWAIQKQESLFKDCAKVKRTDWFERLDEVELSYLEKLEELGPTASKHAELAEFYKMGKALFPQDLPKSFKLKGMYLTCFESFKNYKDAKTGADAAKALQRFDQCSKDAYQDEMPAALKSELACLKVLKN